MPDKHGANLSKVPRTKRVTHFVLIASGVIAVLSCSHVQANSGSGAQRPRILGIATVTILSSDVPAANKFYRQFILPHSVCESCQRPPIRFFGFVSGQRVELREAPAAASDLLLEVSFLTEDLRKLRKFLEEKHIKLDQGTSFPGAPARPIVTHDPEGHQVSFVESPSMMSTLNLTAGADFEGPLRIIHAGWVVHDRAAEDKFYKDILGFHVYWHGGMKDDGEDNWVDMQVPDGTDWIEYMLKVPENATHKQRGVMNHIALGVSDIHAEREQLIKDGWKGTEEPKIGRDGKWQLNLYDPDETRVELMEFTPTKEPCCAPYTGPHPEPK
jgi:catechol 2,3-dioxygenase-like lactoylglutathione lyase family enzyme